MKIAKFLRLNIKKITKLVKKISKKRLFFLASFLVVGLLTGQMVFPLTAQAADPAFNIYTPYTHTQTPGQDYYLLDVKNDTQGTSWGFPVSANAGDILTFYFYYHNASPDTIAYNTTLQIVAPSGQSTYHNVVANLWADNATNASRTNPLSQGVGINLSTAQALQYINGTARWYPNQADWRTGYSTAFPSGQTDIQLFGSGINIGSIQGCWPYSGAIVFQMQVGSVASSQDMSIVKTVRNQSSNDSYSSNISAFQNDRLTFRIQVTNTGNATLNNIVVRDNLPYQLTYVSGSTRVDGNYAADGITTGGINVSSISPGNSRTIDFGATVNSTYAAQTVYNTAYARADLVSERSSSASIYLTPTSQTGNLTINKTVRNLTSGQSYYSESVSASNNDRLSFQIQVNNSSNFIVYNTVVWDNLPSYISYVPGSVRLDGGYAADSLVSGSGINIGSMNANASRTITFEATVNNLGSGYSTQTVTNYAYVRADQISERNDSATVYISQYQYYYPTPSPYYYSNLNLVKMVRNLSADQTALTSSTNAKVGDRVLFTIQLVTPSGGQYNQVNNVRVWDYLPYGLTYVSGSARMDGGYISDSLVSSGVNVGTIFSNQTKVVTFEATVTSYANNQTLTNYAYASADGIAQQSAFAQVVVGQATYVPPSPTPEVKGAAIRAVTGGDSLARNAAVSLAVSLCFLFVLYLVVEYTDFWRNLRLKLAILKIRLKER
jgi:uncharacterized repeat protein (TIGR01451 family)